MVDWVLRRGLNGENNLERVTDSVHRWTDRKKRLMNQDQIKIARDRLLSFGTDLYPHQRLSIQHLITHIALCMARNVYRLRQVLAKFIFHTTTEIDGHHLEGGVHLQIGRAHV